VSGARVAYDLNHTAWVYPRANFEHDREGAIMVAMMRGVMCLGLWLVLALPAGAAKQDFADWKLDVQFVNASKAKSEQEIDDKIKAWVAEAERVYQRRPRLQIAYTVVRQTQKAGQDLSQMIFESNAAYARFMDQNLDNVAVTKTEGHLTVLITDALCIGTDNKTKKPICWGGYGHFPHWVNPFSSKRGITLVSNKDEYTFAHELGHVFGLKHTFEPYIGFNAQCNDDYRPKGKPGGMCNSCANGRVLYDADANPDQCEGPANIMDYCTSTKNNEFLNTCQEQRAANQRYTYMTDDGKTNYFRLKGLAGEAICDADPDCEDGRYCDTGTVGVGRNQCKEVKALGQVCTRGEECSSGRCSALKCAVANECMADPDCGTGRWCNKGLADLGRNICEAKLADGRACTGAGQCSSGSCSEWRPQDGQISGICFTPDSKAAGDSCRIDLECKTGKCNSNKQCVCKNDVDCGSGQWCDAGADTHENTCKPKLNKGETCGKVGELGVGHRCKSGDCKFAGTHLECK
jgi:Metallo-peptidase family M12/Dickkopf N-terminal cysteine-rich region